MGPQRKRQRGLLGVAVDSEDSDYAPSDDDRSSGKDAPRSSSRRGTSPAQPAAARPLPRQQRQQQAGGAAADSGAAPAAGWASLPMPVVAQVFQAVCARGALPMAPRLACVCSRWRAAVAETPELWRVLNTAKLPARAGRSAAAAGGARGRGKGGAKAKRGRGSSTASGSSGGRPPASVGLQGWLESGRLDQLQQLVLGYEDGDLAGDADAGGAFFADAAQSAQAASGAASGAAGVDVAALRLLGERCGQLRSLAIEGPPPLHAEELATVLLAMPQLSELRLSGVRIMPQRGVDTAVRRLLDAAVETGRPSLTSLVLEGCPLLGAKALRGLTPSPLRPPQGEGGDGSSSQQAENADAAGEGGRGGGALLPAPPAFPHMLRLDLSCSGGGCGLLHLQLDALQAAMPALQVLKLSGLGGFHGWVASVRPSAALPGFPQLHTLHVGSGVLQLPSGLVRHGSSHVTDKVLLQLAGRSPLLADLDLSGCQVTCDGLAALAAALAAHTDAAPPAGAAGGAGSALRLRSVDVSRGRLADDDGLAMLAQLCADTLQELTARNAGMRLSDAGLRSLRGCLQLASIDVSSSAVTEDGVRDLLAALPAGVLDELLLGSCRSLSRAARQAAERGGVDALREWLAQQ